MKKNRTYRIRHMLNASREAVDFAEGKTLPILKSDRGLQLILARLLEIVGEAAKFVPSDIKESNPLIPWRRIAKARDWLIHGYFNVDLKIVWTMVSVDLPAIVPELERILQEES